MDEIMISQVIKEIDDELRAQLVYPPFNSAHEGYAVLKEEVEELWAEIKKKDSDRDKNKMREEAKQVAATAIRFMTDLTETK